MVYFTFGMSRYHYATQNYPNEYLLTVLIIKDSIKVNI